jgi:hypothetical protein
MSWAHQRPPLPRFGSTAVKVGRTTRRQGEAIRDTLPAQHPFRLAQVEICCAFGSFYPNALNVRDSAALSPFMFMSRQQTRVSREVA